MSLLDELVRSARERARRLPRGEPSAAPAGPQFDAALRGKDRLKVIAEFKKKSPSRGALGLELDVEKQVRGYQEAGASAVSVLTEPSHFSGSFEDLEKAVATLDVPVLMKDFVVDPAQVRWGAKLGARAVLLIVRCLSRDQLDELSSACESYSVTPLVECHNAREVDKALLISSAVVGVNNRDLDTLEIDTALALRLLEEIPADRVSVAESGYERAEDVRRLKGLADAVLVGSALMTAADPGALLREMTS